MFARGKLIVVEGLDGSGKETQTNLLRAHFIEQGIDLRSVSFPVYASAASAPVRMYLTGKFGSNPDDVNAYAASTFYAVDRYSSYKADWEPFFKSGGLILADRYTTSNAVHQCSKLPEKEWDSYLNWLFNFEYNLLGIPEPDLVIYLSMDPVASRRLVEKRCEREGISMDIHEKDGAYLERCRKAAEYCAALCNWNKIECAPNGDLRSIEDIHEEILKLVNMEGRTL